MISALDPAMAGLIVLNLDNCFKIDNNEISSLSVRLLIVEGLRSSASRSALISVSYEYKKTKNIKCGCEGICEDI